MPNLGMDTAVASSAAVSFSDTTAALVSSGLIRGEQQTTPSAKPIAGPQDDLARNVYCILGVPIDAVELQQVVRRIDVAITNAAPFLISTVNVNFLVNSALNAEFRNSVLLSDLCPADGMPIVWIARLLGIPIKHRVAGSDIFDALKAASRSARPLRVFLFGGRQGVAATAARALNDKPAGLRCVGSIYPGFASVDDMSGDAIIDEVNGSHADLLVVALGAAKGQAWLLHNHHRLRVPVRSHFGAAVNFAAGTFKRAPLILRQLGFEWIWRIKEEPQLWRRYRDDAGALLRLLITRVLPLAVVARSQRFAISKPQELRIDETQQEETAVMLRLSGDATVQHLPQAIFHFRRSLSARNRLTIDVSATRRIDARFFGLFLMLRKQLNSKNAVLKFIGVSPRLARLFRLNGVEFLLSE
jgi:N-acetylglucosaminyldiphosphoundecaprenol N-acetyl-beta-D-mannosaminyltransferase